MSCFQPWQFNRGNTCMWYGVAFFYGLIRMFVLIFWAMSMEHP